MDANVNLQTSSMNTGNISSSPIGYAYFILRQLPDWEENALATHGFTDAIQAPVNTDGDKAVITETCYPYPFRYWNAGSSWMIQPLYETLQCYGDIKIPLSGEIDLDKLRSVLSVTADDLTDEDIRAIEDRGYLRLERDVLLPLLIKSANYWEQLMTPTRTARFIMKRARRRLRMTNTTASCRAIPRKTIRRTIPLPQTQTRLSTSPPAATI